MIMSVILEISVKDAADVLNETGPTRPYWMKMTGAMQPQYYSEWVVKRSISQYWAALLAKG